jgi:hypothetical protein
MTVCCPNHPGQDHYGTGSGSGGEPLGCKSGCETSGLAPSGFMLPSWRSFHDTGYPVAAGPATGDFVPGYGTPGLAEDQKIPTGRFLLP